MSETTKISWSQATWNPAWGCTKVSQGCAHCYAERIVQRTGRTFSDVRETKWRGNKKQDPRLWDEPKRIFTLSMGDFFHEACDAWRDEWWEVIRSCPQHTFLILTKRPERIAQHLPKVWFNEAWNPQGWPWPNVWFGTSVENQEMAEKRIPLLTSIPAKVHFLSCEPLLSDIDFHLGFPNVWTGEYLLRDIDWVIVGGESGPNYREMNLDWARSIRDQCVSVSVPFFYKQLSGPRSEMNPLLDGKEWREFPRV